MSEEETDCSDFKNIDDFIGSIIAEVEQKDRLRKAEQDRQLLDEAAMRFMAEMIRTQELANFFAEDPAFSSFDEKAADVFNAVKAFMQARKEFWEGEE